ncbi:MAG: NHL repeat-containing protein [Nitrospirales bacterium]|nr:NHL repeat-containing protein [Nitrospirales bacterium]
MSKTLQSGYVTTVAGNGEPGLTGDGAEATLASLNEPKDVVFDQEGNLYVADSENHVIRRIDRQSGMIQTFVGSPDEPDNKSDGPSAPNPQNVQEEDVDPLADFDDSPTKAYTQTPDLSGTVRYVVGKRVGATRFGGDGEAANHARLNFPSGIATDDQGALYIADTWNHRIRRVDPLTGMIHTIAGTGQPKWTGDGGQAHSAALNEPVALVVDRKGKLYIADQTNNRVRMIDTLTGVITTVAGTGEAEYNGDQIPATEAALSGPSGLALDAQGNLYIADTFNGRIRKIDAETGKIETVLGDGESFRYQPGYNDGSFSLARPYGIAFDRQGCLLITDSDNHLLRKWDPEAKKMSVIAGSGFAQYAGDEGPAEKSSLNFPFGVAVDGNGNIALADTFNHRIRMIRG